MASARFLSSFPMANKTLFSFLLFSCAVFTAVYAQTSARIMGSTVDKSTGLGIRGVNISIEGTYYGAVSDAEGRFAITTSVMPPFTLLLERVAYSPTKIAVSEKSASLRIELQSKTATAVRKEEAATAEEYDVKLLLLEKMVSMITWDSAALSKEKPFVIGVLGDNPFGDAVFALENKTIQGHSVQVAFIAGAEDLGNVQVLFVASSKRNKKLYADLLPVLATQSVLTVADDKEALGNPAMIAFFKHEDHLRFSMLPKLAKAVGIAMSAKLIEMGQ